MRAECFAVAILLSYVLALFVLLVPLELRHADVDFDDDDSSLSHGSFGERLVVGARPFVDDCLTIANSTSLLFGVDFRAVDVNAAHCALRVRCSSSSSSPSESLVLDLSANDVREVFRSASSRSLRALLLISGNCSRRVIVQNGVVGPSTAIGVRVENASNVELRNLVVWGNDAVGVDVVRSSNVSLVNVTVVGSSALPSSQRRLWAEFERRWRFLSPHACADDVRDACSRGKLGLCQRDAPFGSSFGVRVRNSSLVTLRGVRVRDIVASRVVHWWLASSSSSSSSVFPVSSPLGADALQVDSRDALRCECRTAGLFWDDAPFDVVGVWVGGGSRNVSLSDVRVGRVAVLPFSRDGDVSSMNAIEHAFHLCAGHVPSSTLSSCSLESLVSAVPIRISPDSHNVSLGADVSASSIKNSSAYV